ncbi:unnamed protein product [Lymnaea stagnalis]|uniref:F-box domain-containing protein n=1 Tax=Lymnaea stagnalis TaxID=6523 RepID=A0AAV2HCE0_LYMST
MSTTKRRKSAQGTTPPRTHSYERDNWKDKLRPRPVWSALPPNALREIYLHSAFEDRISMGTVCKSWRQGYRDPALWRSRLFEFGGCTSYEELEYNIFVGAKQELTFTSGTKAKGFADQFSTCLEDLEILLKEMDTRSANGILSEFLEFYSSLEESRLRSLTLYNLNLKSLNDAMRKRFLNSFIEVTSGQKFLKKFSMDFPNFDIESGLQFLKCIADSCGDTIETLYLKRCFEIEVSIYQQQHIVTALENHFQKFKSLCRIHVEYFIVSEELIMHWAQGCPNLSFIKFWVTRIALPSMCI